MTERWRKATTMPLHEYVLVRTAKGLERVGYAVGRLPNGKMRVMTQSDAGYPSDVHAIKWKPLEGKQARRYTRHKPADVASIAMKVEKAPIMCRKPEELDWLKLEESAESFGEGDKKEATLSSNGMMLLWIIVIFAASALGSFAGELFAIGSN